MLDVLPAVDAELSQGLWGSFAERRMRAPGGAELPYNIYAEPSHSTIWGDGTGGSSTVLISGGLLQALNWSASRDMFGLAAPAQNTTPGAYADTVIVRVIF